MRSRASSESVERYARQVLLPAPTAAASDWQCASAPSRPPRSPPRPGFELVTKKLMFAGACASATPTLTAKTPSAPSALLRFINVLLYLDAPDERNRLSNVTEAL